MSYQQELNNVLIACDKSPWCDLKCIFDKVTITKDGRTKYPAFEKLLELASYLTPREILELVNIACGSCVVLPSSNSKAGCGCSGASGTPGSPPTSSPSGSTGTPVSSGPTTSTSGVPIPGTPGGTSPTSGVPIPGTSTTSPTTSGSGGTPNKPSTSSPTTSSGGGNPNTATGSVPGASGTTDPVAAAKKAVDDFLKSGNSWSSNDKKTADSESDDADGADASDSTDQGDANETPKDNALADELLGSGDNWGSSSDETADNSGTPASEDSGDYTDY